MRTVTLGELITQAGPKVAEGNGLPVYSVTKHAGFVPSLEYFKKQVFSRDVDGYRLVEPGDFAYATIHLDEGSIGIAPERALISPMYTVFRLDESRVDPSYMIRFLKSPRALTHYPQLGKGAIHRRKAISFSALGSLCVPLPSVAEQRRIAAILDQADTLRAKRRQVLAHLDALTQAVFDKMFGGVSDSSPLGELVEEFRYGTSNKSGASGYPTLRIPNVIGGALNLDEIKIVDVKDAERQRLRLQRGDLLFVRTNGNPENVGRCAVFDPSFVESSKATNDTWIYASYLIRGRLAEVHDPDFVATFMATSTGRRQLRERSKTSAGQYNINIGGLGSVQVPVAPTDQQRAFGAHVESINVQRAGERRALAVHDELFASLQSRAFRGEL